jgi:hypothetical protein
MQRSWVRWFLALAVMSATLAACGSGSDRAPSSSSPSTSGPQTMSLAVISSAADPNALDDDRIEVLDTLGQGAATHVVVSPGACYTGLPAHYGSSYVLAIWDTDEGAVRGRVDDAGRPTEWVGRVTSTCVD